MKVPVWARYVKLELLSHYGQEHYCTVSQIKVHGSTVLQGFHEQWQETDAADDDGGDGESKESLPRSREDDSEPTASGSDSAAESERNAGADVNTADPSGTRGDQSTSEVAPEGRDGERPADDVSPRNGRSALGIAGRAIVAGGFDPTSNTASCLASAAIASRSLEHADPRQPALPASTMPGRWKRAPLNLSRRMATLPETEPVPQDHYPVIAEKTRLLKPPLPTSALPLIRRMQRVCKLSGWNVSYDGIRPLERYSRHLSDASSDQDESLPGAPGSLESAHGSETPYMESQSDEPRGASIPEIVEVREVNEVAAGPRLEVNDSGEAYRNVPASCGGMLSYLLDRYPAASCLAKLDSAALRLGQAKRSPGGGHGSAGGTNPGAGGMEPVFKKLTDEIKALQAGLAAYDEWAKQSAACYQQVLLEMLVDMESHRRAQDSRLQRLESDFFGAGAIAAARSLVIHLLTLMRRVVSLVALSDCGMLGMCLRVSAVAVLVGAMMLKKRRDRFRHPETPPCQSSEHSVASSCGSSSAPELCSHVQETPKVVMMKDSPGPGPNISPLKKDPE
jgi:hypothetical protein